MKGKVFVEKKNLFDGFFKDVQSTADYYERELKKLEIKSKAQDIEMRKTYANQIFHLMVYYLFAVFLILFLSGSPSSFKMSDNVLMVLLGTTTANVIGLFAIVMNYLFPKK